MLRLSMTTPLRGSLLGDILRMIGVIEFVVSRFLHKNIPVTCAVGHRLVSRNKAAFTNNARALNGTGGEMSASERFIVRQWRSRARGAFPTRVYRSGGPTWPRLVPI